MESFKKHLHEIRVAWVQLSGKKKIESIKEMAKIDSDAVVKMKTIGRKRISKGLSDPEELKDYLEYVDIWLEEASGSPPELAIWQKIGIMSYARAIAP